jgi:hypothetical protein
MTHFNHSSEVEEYPQAISTTTTSSLKLSQLSHVNQETQPVHLTAQCCAISLHLSKHYVYTAKEVSQSLYFYDDSVVDLDLDCNQNQVD